MTLFGLLFLGLSLYVSIVHGPDRKLGTEDWRP